MTDRPPAEGWARRPLVLAAAVLLAVLVRVAVWPEVFPGGEARLGQADGYYHLRRVAILLETFPSVPAVDRYMAYPQGAECPWPPLFDLAAAALAKGAVLLGASPPAAAAAVLALLPSLLGILAVFPAYSLGRTLLGRREAAAAALFLGSLPFHVAYSDLGSGDHHSAEALLLAACYAFLFRALAAPPGRGADRDALLSGAALGGALLTWQGAVVYAVPVPAALGLHALFPPAGRQGGAAGEGEGATADPFRAGAAVLATAALLAAAGRALYPSATAVTRFEFGHFSWFQPAFLLALLAALPAVRPLAAIVRPAAGGGAPSRPFRAALLLAAASAGAAILLVPSLRGNVAGGLSFLFTTHPSLEQITELSNYVLSPLPERGGAAAVRVLEGLSMLLPLALAGSTAAGELRRRGGISPSAALLAALTLLLAVLAFRQARWQNAYALLLALSFGWAVVRVREAAGVAAAVAAAALLAVPSARTAAWPLLHPGTGRLPGKVEAMLWLRDHSPPTSHLWDSAAVPEYSVLASWDAGHHVQWFARRPTVANNFGYQLPGGGLEDTVRARYAPDGETLLALLDRRGARYVVADRDDLFGTGAGLASLAGIDYRERFERLERGGDGRERPVPTEEFLSLPFTRLLLDRGGPSVHGAAVPGLRLVHETAPSPGGEATGLVYERVRGARVTGRAAPGSTVLLALRLDAGGGREFEYSAAARADGSGNFAAPFPYATEGANGSVLPRGRGVALFPGGRTATFAVTGEDVERGGTVTVR